MRLYVSGPMRGLPGFGHSTFERAACALRGQGHEVFSRHQQAEADGFDLTGSTGTEDLVGIGLDPRRALALSLGWICADAEGLVVLPSWHKAQDAKAEVSTALALDLPVWRFASFVSLGEEAPRVKAAPWALLFSRDET